MRGLRAWDLSLNASRNHVGRLSEAVDTTSHRVHNECRRRVRPNVGVSIAPRRVGAGRVSRPPGVGGYGLAAMMFRTMLTTASENGPTSNTRR